MISVIIPAYNAAGVITRCIRSLQVQTEPDFELLIVDDGSGDNTVDVVAALASEDTRIRLIRQKNAGVSAARNHGIDCAAGELICFVDSDDWVSPNFLQRLRSMYAPGSLPAVSVCRSDTVGPVTAPMPAYYPLLERWEDDYLCGVLGRGILFSVWNKLFSAQVLREKRLRFSEKLRIGEDLMFVLQYLRFCRDVRFDPEAVYHYEISEGSAVASRRDYTADYEALLAELMEFSTQQPFHPTALAQWAFDAVVLVTANPYVCEQPYDAFCDWWDAFCRTTLFKTAVQTSISVRGKRAVFYRAIQSGSRRSIYLLLRSFRCIQENGKG